MNPKNQLSQTDNTKTCPICGKQFQRQGTRTKYCSKECAKQVNYSKYQKKPHGRQYSSIGGRIMAARIAANMTQMQLAEKLGVSKQNVSKFEHHSGFMREDTLLNIAAALGTTLEKIIATEPIPRQKLSSIQAVKEDATPMAALIQSYRTSNHLRQKDLAEMLNVSIETVHNWETGKVIPKTHNLLALSDIFGPEFKTAANRIKQNIGLSPEFIREMRLANNLTQAALADKIGVRKITISRWECGRAVPPKAQRQKLINMLNKSTGG